MVASSLSKNANYLVTVSQGGTQGVSRGLSVTTNAMAKLSLQIDNRWVNILEALGLSADSGGIGGTVASVVNGALLAAGNNFLPLIATSHVWRGSTGIELGLQMRFDAVDGAPQDVLLPVQTMLRIFSPTRAGAGGSGLASSLESTFLHPPGPTPFEYIAGTAGERTITALIGKFMKITNLIPTTIQIEAENRYTVEGDPVAMLVNCSFISYTLPDQAELLSFFLNQVQAAGVSAPDQQPAGGTPPPGTNPALTAQ